MSLILKVKKSLHPSVYVHGQTLGGIATTLQDLLQPPRHEIHQVSSFTPTERRRERAGKQGPNTLYQNRARFGTARPIFLKFLVCHQHSST